MDLRLRGKVAVVTGGASGIGLACATELAREGCEVGIWDVSPRAAEMAATLKIECGVLTCGLTVDVSSLVNVESVTAQTEASLGPIEIVVHAAAVSSGKFGFPFTNVSPADWRRVLDVNVMGMVHLAQTIAPQMIARRSGSMVFIASVAGQIGSQTDPPYSASKAANINFAQCLAKDLAPHGVRVNTVCPGMVQTPLNRAVWQAWNDQQTLEDRRAYEDWANEKVRNVIPLKRWQQPEDVANLVTFLASSRASEMTGQTINVDGGFVMHW
jgi:2-hydroxycyclohexanecarboxyl-CoA dehydrogenase